MRSSMRRPGRAATLVAVVVAATVVASSCNPIGSGDESVETVPGVPSGTVAVPPERLTPFCQAMIDLSERLENDPPDDIDAYIIEEYTKISDAVPPEIAVEFEAVLARLRGEPLPTVADPVDGSASTAITTAITTAGTERPSGTDAAGSLAPEGDEFFEEGYLPGDDPAERLNAYVAFVCRDSQNNPGPPATQPLDEITPTTVPS